MEPFYDKNDVTIYCGDCFHVMRQLKESSVDCIVTSPPYYALRDYGVDGQIGLENTLGEYIQQIVGVFRLAKSLLRDSGTLWLNLGDTYAGSWGAQSRGQECNERKSTLLGNQSKAMPHKAISGPEKSTGLKAKNLCGVPWRVAFALQEDGWYLRSDVIWHKPNPMPTSQRDRPTLAHEYLFLLTKSKKYYFDHHANGYAVPCVESNDARPRMGQGPNSRYSQKRQGMKVPKGWATEGDHSSVAHSAAMKSARPRFSNESQKDVRNRRTVWTVPIQPFKGAHFATYPKKLIEPCIAAGCPPGGTVFDPFTGSGTTAAVAQSLGRKFVGSELNPEYCEMAASRFKQRRLFT